MYQSSCISITVQKAKSLFVTWTANNLYGSNTSSGSIFIDYVKPKISIISVGKNNKYGLPDSNVLAKLNRYGLVYETSKRGNIEIIVKKNNLEVLSYR